MSRISDALVDGTVRVLVLARHGHDVLVRGRRRVAEGLARLDLVVSFDLFMNDTARRYAHIVLPGTAWVEELGAKATNTHVYLMPKAVEPAGECRSSMWMLRELARRMDVPDFFPWSDDAGPLDAILDHPRAGHATVAALIAEGGQRALNISHVGHSDLKFPTPSGKVELYSERAVALGLPALPTYEPLPTSGFPLQFRQGRTLTTSTPSTITGARCPLWPMPIRSPCSGCRRAMRPRAGSTIAHRSACGTSGARCGRARTSRSGSLRARCGCATGGKG